MQGTRATSLRVLTFGFFWFPFPQGIGRDDSVKDAGRRARDGAGPHSGAVLHQRHDGAAAEGGGRGCEAKDAPPDGSEGAQGGQG